MANLQLLTEALQRAWRVSKNKDAVVANLLRLLRREGKTRRLSLIIQTLEEMEAERQGIQRGILEFAHPVSGSIQKTVVEKVEELLRVKRLTPRIRLNSHLVGGGRAIVGWSVLDFSVRAVIKRARRT